VTSTWRLKYEWMQFSDLFDNRLIGQTPWLDLNEEENQYQRYHEMQAYLQASGWEHLPWLALDENSNGFPSGCHVYITKSEMGLTSDDADRIIETYLL